LRGKAAGRRQFDFRTLQVRISYWMPITPGRRVVAEVDMNESSISNTYSIHDSSGYPIFAGGELGGAHSHAHQLLDSARAAEGRLLLGRWLEGRSGRGSRWVHLQWHMVVFELAAGAWWQAYERFTTHVLPATVEGDAETDAPSGLWRLALARPRAALPWAAVRRAALGRRGARVSSWVRAHDLLAFAGAEDRVSLTSWVQSAEHEGRGRDETQTLLRLAEALLAWIEQDWSTVAVRLGETLPSLVTFGGSRAQHELFADMRAEALRRGGARRASTSVRQSAPRSTWGRRG
jgi:hypothetical protein